MAASRPGMVTGGSSVRTGPPGVSTSRHRSRAASCGCAANPAGVRSRAHFFQTEIKFHLRHWRWIEVPISYRNPSNSVGLSSIKEAFVNLWRLSRQASAACPAREAA